MNKNIIFSMCNQDRKGHGRINCLGVLDITGSISWLKSATTRKDYGITGIVQDDFGLYVAIQTRRERLRVTHFQPKTYKIIESFPLSITVDPHSLCIHQGQLLLASSGTNKIILLRRKAGVIVHEEVFWHYPDTSETIDEVHLNCIADFEGSLFATVFGLRDENGTFTANGSLLNISTGEVCYTGFNQPHSILFHNDKIYCASSGTSELFILEKINDKWHANVILLRGYPRGLTSYGDDILVGISAHREVSRSKGYRVHRSYKTFERSQVVRITSDGREKGVIADVTTHGAELYDLMGVYMETNLPTMTSPTALVGSFLKKIFK